MRTQHIGSLELDQARLAEDLETSAGFRYSEAYSDYLCGGPWKSAVLWAASGDNGDGLVTNYDYAKAPDLTDYGKQLPYIWGLVADLVDLTRLNFARLAVISDSVIIPHRDLLELESIPGESRNAHRMHIPLVTNDRCFFSSGNEVYRMAEGEVWFFDAAQVHSAASLSSTPRVHLMLDFTDQESDEPLVKLPYRVDGGIPADRVERRPPMSEEERAELLGLAPLITMDNYRDVFSIVIKKHFRADGGDDFVWRTMREIARAGRDPAVAARIDEMQRYFTLERSA
ncbi:aspartyl/asparaginyl beta-hydroxylase domain-containing protein [Amycolatopsis sp. FU40]|uniref:aspartyl/asparaginyl beta-hydroxylase domain-containing protein n=1 Tax=Amycolatopsis sp. FU40 TaxID=2914159 RepID=UPI001F022C1D|nr:aspartyl/asparaginyl beta-hydroxylase domain-containing protein [Amycolatopsis sp. FU40]UKD58032.1 aspartyl/asparaginyl beta-hydroxylase domain-containing protein [Amycolatopsis sp. FU40]